MHTPGPWSLDFQGEAWKGSWAVLTERGWGEGGEFPWIATVEGTHVGPASHAEVDANARLIAAAPELLEGLKELLFAAWGLVDEKYLRDAREIIAKAEGAQ